MGSGWTLGRLAADVAAGKSVGDGHRRVNTHALVQGYTSLSLSSCSFFYYSRQWCTYPYHTRGSSILATDTSNFVLNNVLVVPSIVRNLLSIHQFTSDNSCSIEFDAFWFLCQEPQDATRDSSLQ
jgi:hypothetical protein